MFLLRSLLSGSGHSLSCFLVVLADVYSLYRIRGIRAFRQCADRFSNGDENEVSIRVESSYPHPVSLEIIDEIPFIFQKRDVDFQGEALEQTREKQLPIVFDLLIVAFTLSVISEFL